MATFVKLNEFNGVPSDHGLDSRAGEIAYLKEELIKTQTQLIQRNFELIAAREIILEYKRREVGI